MYPLVKATDKQDETIAYSLLKPLLAGKPVMLRLDDPGMRKKKRMDTVILYLTLPVPGVLLISIPGYGCEACLVNELKPITFYRTGMTMKASKIMAREVKEVLTQQESNDGNIT